MKRNRFYSLAYVVLWPVIHVLFRPVVTGKERIPDGNAVFCCNPVGLCSFSRSRSA